MDVIGKRLGYLKERNVMLVRNICGARLLNIITKVGKING
tara:strand:- start:7874 stop:7993 length:120 start_codon:yes stop_codon:yes gene_type:complete